MIDFDEFVTTLREQASELSLEQQHQLHRDINELAVLLVDVGLAARESKRRRCTHEAIDGSIAGRKIKIPLTAEAEAEASRTQPP